MSREDEKASANPQLVIADECTGSRYARMVGVKGLGEGGSMGWLLDDVSTAVKRWGHTGGPDQELIVKSDGEHALIAAKEAVMKYHGGIMVPMHRPKARRPNTA